MSKPSKVEREEREYALRARRMQLSFSAFNHAVRWGGIVTCVYIFGQAIESLAGEFTIADIAVQFLGRAWISTGLAWVLAGGGIFYGLRQRKLRRDTVERLSPAKVQREKEIDPGRSSSRLTPRGETNPEDEI